MAKLKAIALHYAVQDQQREQRLFFQDITISAPNRIGPKTYTFRIEAVHKFDSDTTRKLFPRLLYMLYTL
ncbi:hypothetical protein ACLBQD_32040, partial [Klebsiella pneumoniae]